ncbi:MAG: TauD/TfdA family dioxygenase [Hyphomicrobiales bacterium]|nr:TauD/TfdA family dioxygenase [Hyphomicrobiales bacterium]
MGGQIMGVELLDGPNVWIGSDMADRGQWIIHFGEADRAELEAAAESVRKRNLLLDDATKDDFHLPRLSSILADVRDELETGRGFVMMRGLPSKAYSNDELGTLFWGIGTHLGIGVSQSRAGDRLGHVMDIGSRDTRYYTRGGALEFHMDPVDVVGLFCLQSAKSGGESRIISALNVYNIILNERPDLMENLKRGFYYSRRAQDPDATGRNIYTQDRIEVFKEGGNGMECYYLPASFRAAAQDGAAFSEKDAEAFAFMDEVCNRPENWLDMEFQEGDMQFLSNRAVLHARTDYEEHDDPVRKRHLLRLWLMMPQWPKRPMTMRSDGEDDRGGGGIAKAAAE